MKIQTLTKLFLAGIVCLPITLAAQKILNPIKNPAVYKTEIIHPDQGLSSTLLECIYEDRYGFIWIGSQYGLDRYDNYSITRMSDVGSDSASTSMEWVWSIDEDRSGTLWVCSSKGLFRYDRLHNSFEMLLPNLKEPDSEDNTVYSMKQDSRDIYWLFTKGGLFSYDRKANLFKEYKKDSIITDETKYHGDILYWWNQMRFYEDHSGTIWIGSDRGLKKYDRQNDQFITFRHDPDDPQSISHNYFSCITEDKFRNLWISATSYDGSYGSLNKMIDREKGIFQRYIHNKDDAKSLVSRCWPLYIDRSHNLWIGGKDGFSIYNYETDNFDNYKLPTYAVPGFNFLDNLINRIMEDSKGNLWMHVFVRGLLSFNPSSEKISHYYWDPDNLNNLAPDIQANTILEDRSGSIWVSGEARITRSDPLLKPFYSTTPEMLDFDSEGDMTILSLYSDNNGTLWLGIPEQGMLKSTDYIPDKPNEFTQISPDLRPYCFIKDNRGQLWMGTMLNGLGKVNEQTNTIKWFRSDANNPDSLSHDYITMMYEDQRHIFWIATSDEGLNIFHPESERFISIKNIPEDTASLVSNKMIAINNDRHGNIWFGSFLGLSKLEVSQGLADSIRAVFTGELKQESLNFKFQNFKNNPFDPYSLSCNQIVHMYADVSGRLWIGTTNGLNLYDDSNEIFYVFTEADGLPDNCIFGILEDDQGNLWLSTRKGICKVVLKDGIGPDLVISVQSYKKEDGLQGDIFFENTCQKTNDGWMFFGGNHGFTVFHPDSIRDNINIPPVYITDIRINNESVYSRELSLLDTGLFETEKIELSHKQNFLAFEYLALNYSNAEQNRYRYMMEGLDNDWVEAGTRRFAEYRDLKPGDYTFRVLGSNDDGVWNEEGASIGIIINPPWYRTILAYLLYLILIAVAIYGYIQWRTYLLRKEKENLEKQVKERTTIIEEQKDELLQQKEELQITLDRLQETQTQLIQSEKLAALGGLVAGVAHEINTPVGISVTAASNLAEETRKMAEQYKANKISRTEFKEYLNAANQSANLILSNMERTATMVQSFKQVSVDQSTEHQRVFNLKEYSADVIRSLYPQLKSKKVRIKLDIDDQLELHSYPGAFSQILTNLVLNSLVHGFDMKDKGNINISARQADEELILEYRDDGRGISKQNLDKIYDPFFTTNKKAGTGLGLHIVYNIVNQKLNGSITCSSEKEKGVSFRMKIPVQS